MTTNKKLKSLAELSGLSFDELRQNSSQLRADIERLGDQSAQLLAERKVMEARAAILEQAGLTEGNTVADVVETARQIEEELFSKTGLRAFTYSLFVDEPAPEDIRDKAIGNTFEMLAMQRYTGEGTLFSTDWLESVA